MPGSLGVPAPWLVTLLGMAGFLLLVNGILSGDFAVWIPLGLVLVFSAVWVYRRSLRRSAKAHW